MQEQVGANDIPPRSSRRSKGRPLDLPNHSEYELIAFRAIIVEFYLAKRSGGTQLNTVYFASLLEDWRQQVNYTVESGSTVPEVLD